MYLSYIDESGKAEWTDPEPDYVLAALTINERDWKDIDDRVHGLKQKYFPNANPEEIELHATDIFGHKKIFKNMKLEKRLNIFLDIMTLINSVNCAITLVIIRKDELYNKRLEVDDLAMQFLFERICYHLNYSNGNNKLSGQNEEYGILMIDSINTKYDNKVRKKIKYLFENGTEYQKNNYLIEDPIFINSNYRNLSQLVDCIAYCTRRHFRKKEVDPMEREAFETYFELMKPKLVNNSSRCTGYGIKIFP